MTAPLVQTEAAVLMDSVYAPTVSLATSVKVSVKHHQFHVFHLVYLHLGGKLREFQRRSLSLILLIVGEEISLLFMTYGSGSGAGACRYGL